MDNTYFLITDLSNRDCSHQLLHALTCAQFKTEVFVFVKDFDQMKTLRDEFPTTIFILLDQTKNKEINIAFLRLLPGIDCFLNFTGKDFDGDLCSAEISITNQRGMTNSKLSMEKISQVLINNDEPGASGASLITISPEASNGSDLKEMLHRMLEETSPSSSVRFRASSRYRATASSFHASPQENEPLLSRTLQQESPEPGFLSCLFCFCCCPSNDQPEITNFDTQEELRSYIRMQHKIELKYNLEKLFDHSQSEWDRIMRKLHQKEQKKLQELYQKVEDRQSEDEMELQKKKDQENATTDARLLPVDLKEKIKTTRERQVKSKLRYDTRQSQREGEHLIKQAAEMERELSRGNHYINVLENQFQILTSANDKYKSKLNRLLLRYFQIAAKNV